MTPARLDALTERIKRLAEAAAEARAQLIFTGEPTGPRHRPPFNHRRHLTERRDKEHFERPQFYL